MTNLLLLLDEFFIYPRHVVTVGLGVANFGVARTFLPLASHIHIFTSSSAEAESLQRNLAISKNVTIDASDGSNRRRNPNPVRPIRHILRSVDVLLISDTTFPSTSSIRYSKPRIIFVLSLDANVGAAQASLPQWLAAHKYLHHRRQNIHVYLRADLHASLPRNIPPSGKTSLKIGVRLEGGLGDHILGLRILKFIKQRFPKAQLTLFSDAGGHRPQLQLSRLARPRSRVVAVFKTARARRFEDNGYLFCLNLAAKRAILGCDLFFDTWGRLQFIEPARCLGISHLQILDSIPRLGRPVRMQQSAIPTQKPSSKRYTPTERLESMTYIVMNISKYGSSFLLMHANWLQEFVREIIQQSSLKILNITASSYQHSHLCAAQKRARVASAKREAAILSNYSHLDPRIVYLDNLTFTSTYHLINRCAFYVGVDNGLKHLAWALRKPLLYILPSQPSHHHIARWMPDYHNSIVVNCDAPTRAIHLKRMRLACTSKLPLPIA